MKKQITKIAQKIPLNSRNFQKIITFFMFECPVPDVSFRGHTLKEFGWDNPNKLCLLVRLLKQSASKDFRDNYYCCLNEDECKNSLKLLPNKSSSIEYCMYLGSDSKNRIQSLLRSIRNAFAHGSFYIDSRKYYHLENFHKSLKAKICLSEETLLKWICVIKNDTDSPNN